MELEKKSMNNDKHPHIEAFIPTYQVFALHECDEVTLLCHAPILEGTKQGRKMNSNIMTESCIHLCCEALIPRAS
jgi:hypothetical protein